MVRSFLPVGQGAFYVEQFRDGTNVVYDCGSLTDVKIVNKEIGNTFEEGETIAAVFISHLHEDHMNGLPRLLSYCQVRRIYLPYLTPDEINLMKLSRRIEGGSQEGFVDRFLDNPRDAVIEATEKSDLEIPQIVYVMPEREELSEDDSNRSDIVRIGSGTEISDIVSRIREDEGWRYIPFNFRERKRKEIFLEELAKKGYGDIDKLIDELLHESGSASLRKGIWKDVCDAYRKVPGDFNTNSMAVYSGHIDLKIAKRHYMRLDGAGRTCCCYGMGCAGCCYPAGALYTGDYDANGEYKRRDLFRAYSDYWDNIGVIQVPHHGSRYNFSSSFLERNKFLVMSAGSHNKHRHPHTSVMKQIILAEIAHAWVTEFVVSRVQFLVD